MFKKILLSIAGLSLLLVAGVSYAEEGQHPKPVPSNRAEILEIKREASKDVRQYRKDYREKRDVIRNQREELRQNIQQDREDIVNKVKTTRDEFIQKKEEEMKAFRERMKNAQTEEERQQIIEEAKKRREEVRAELEQKKEAFKTEIRDKYANAYQKRLGFAKERFGYVIERMGRISDRINKAIATLEENGVDMSEAKKHLNLAEQNFDKAKTLYQNAIEPVDIENIQTREEAKQMFDKTKAGFKAVIDALKATREHLVASVRIIKDGVRRAKIEKRNTNPDDVGGDR